MSTFIIGQGAMGSLVAHELALGNLLVPTLLMKSKKALEVYSNNGGAITVMRPLKADSISSTVPVEAIYGLGTKLADREPIENLIIATKTYSTADAVQKYLPHISKDTNILFLQNGMGVIPQLEQKFWPNSWDVPKFFHAISTHGAYKTSPNVVHHVGLGGLLISQLPRGDNTSNNLSNFLLDIPGMVRGLTESPHLEALYVPYAHFILRQMEKLVVNACINPLTATLDCLNGDLLFARSLVPTLKKIIGECIECFNKEYDISSMGPEAGIILSRDRLLSSVVSICKSTAQNSSSMREDVRRLKNTEIDSINGYIVSLGAKRKIATPANRMLLDLVKNKVAIERAKENQAYHSSFLI